MQKVRHLYQISIMRCFLLLVISTVLYEDIDCRNYIQNIRGINIPPVPVVMWHGVGDHCCNHFMMSIKKLIEDNVPNIYVLSLRIGSSVSEDFQNSYFMDVNEQIQYVCQELLSNQYLVNGYNAIGFSQGAQFLRGVIQRCPDPPVHNFISIGGQHQGVYGIPNCSKGTTTFCNYLRKIVSLGIYNEWVQKHSVQAQYWHDPLHEDLYKRNSGYLADINNEISENMSYKENIKKLHNMVLIKFTNDSTVVPVESEWFGFFVPGQANMTYTLEQSRLYKEDRLGLKYLHSTGRLHFMFILGDHMHFDNTWFLKNVIWKYLR